MISLSTQTLEFDQEGAHLAALPARHNFAPLAPAREQLLDLERFLDALRKRAEGAALEPDDPRLGELGLLLYLVERGEDWPREDARGFSAGKEGGAVWRHAGEGLHIIFLSIVYVRERSGKRRTCRCWATWVAASWTTHSLQVRQPSVHWTDGRGTRSLQNQPSKI